MRVKINGSYYDNFDEVSVSKTLDSIASVFSFKARFNPDDNAHKIIFKPLSYNTVEIFNNSNELIFTGVSLNTDLSSSKSRALQSISGYSYSGVLEDCSIPYSAYPLEKNNVSLKDIVLQLLKPYSLSFVIDESVAKEMDFVYNKVVAKPTESIKAFISKLSSQRDIILSHNNKGDLVFYKPSINNKPVLSLDSGNTLSMNLKVNGQSLHSVIDVIRQPSKANTSLNPVDTIRNPLVLKNRTIVKVLNSGNETSTKEASKNILSNELKNIIFTASLKGFININCGDIVEVKNKEIYLYETTKLIVSSVSLNKNKSSELTSLTMSLLETFTGETPNKIF